MDQRLIDELLPDTDLVVRAYIALLEYSQEGIILVQSRQGVPRVVCSSRRFQEMFTVAHTTLEGAALDQLPRLMHLPKNSQRGLIQQWRSALIERLPAEGMLHGMTTVGGAAEIAWRLVPLIDAGRTVGCMMTFRDVTLEQSGRALRSNLIRRISHELRTPLTAIQGFAELMIGWDQEALSSNAREYLAIIYRGARQLGGLFSEMITLMRYESGDLTLSPRLSDPQDILQRARDGALPALNSRQQTLRIKNLSYTAMLLVDPNAIASVLIQLLTNAGKFSPAGSQIDLLIRLLEPEAVLPPSAPDDLPLPSILFEVRDTSVGFWAEEIDYIFLPFYRGKQHQDAQIEGYGLGLTIAQVIVERHHGVMWAAANTLDEPGGRIYVCLPLS